MVSAASVMGTLLVVRDMRQRAEGPLYPVSLSRSATVLPRANLRLGTKSESTRSTPPRTTATPTRAMSTRTIMTSIATLSAALDLRQAALTALRSPAQYGAADPKLIPAREGGHHGSSRDSCRAPRRTRSGLHARDQRQSLASPVHGRAYRPRD